MVDFKAMLLDRRDLLFDENGIYSGGHYLKSSINIKGKDITGFPTFYSYYFQKKSSGFAVVRKALALVRQLVYRTELILRDLKP